MPLYDWKVGLRIATAKRATKYRDQRHKHLKEFENTVRTTGFCTLLFTLTLNYGLTTRILDDLHR